MPRQHVLVPGEVEPVQALRDLGAVLQADVAKVIGGQRYFVSDDGAHLGHVLLQIVQSHLGDTNAGKWMHHVVGIVMAAAGGALQFGILELEIFHGSTGQHQLLDKVPRAGQRSGYVAQQIDADVHL